MFVAKIKIFWWTNKIATVWVSVSTSKCVLVGSFIWLLSAAGGGAEGEEEVWRGHSIAALRRRASELSAAIPPYLQLNYDAHSPVYWQHAAQHAAQHDAQHAAQHDGYFYNK